MLLPTSVRQSGWQDHLSWTYQQIRRLLALPKMSCLHEEGECNEAKFNVIIERDTDVTLYSVPHNLHVVIRKLKSLSKPERITEAIALCLNLRTNIRIDWTLWASIRENLSAVSYEAVVPENKHNA